MSRKKAYYYALILLAVIFWGASFAATKIALQEIEPVTIIILRLILASFLLLAFALITKRNFTVNLKSHTWIFILALVAVFHLWIQVEGLKYTTASNTGWIIGTAPIFMALLALMFFKERITLLQLAGIIIAMFGLLLLFGKGNLAQIDLIENKGDLLVLGSAFTWGVYSMVNKKISLSYSPLMTILYLFIMMTIIILPFNIDKAIINSVLQLSLAGWISILFLGLLCSGVAYVIWAYSLRDLDSAKVGAFLYFEPFITVLFAWFLLKENITLIMILSGIIITAGVFMVNKD
ncbi:MAG: DMT family transporter [Ignavibacteria bacterium]|nr:DMT family transporter [Ignavibacteria bacterium]MBT8381473.1 DMT family transporter [Ignavibacteria bacterium]MBT8391535.1 DMT family transporter [Ignavibacteria bacterium]NNJ52227.1 DMT family transporter [Ignavibacteriaceae bacterium]NNL22703.1 DMT family transporter [Ignavibacteriaceae bacterium]